MSELRTPTIDTDRGAPEALTIVSTVGQFPRAQVRFHSKTSGGIVRALASGMLSEAAKDQAQMLEPRLAPDTSIRMSDGVGEEVEFEGFTTAPSHTLGIGAVGNSYTAIHSSSLLSLYDPTIYAIRTQHNADDRLGSLSQSVTKRMLDMLKSTVKTWQTEDGRVRGSASADEMADQIHAQNKKIEPIILKLLQRSTAEIKGLDRFGRALNRNVNFQLWKTLFSTREDFFAALTAVLAQWQMYYAPSKGMGEVGTIHTMDELSGKGTKKSLLATSITISAGPLSIIPVTQVVVNGTASMAPRPAKVGSFRLDGGAPQLVSYPATYRGGRTLRISLPPFLGMPLKSNAAGGGSDVSIEGYINARDKTATDQEDILESHVKTFVQNYAKNTYIDAVLASSNAVLTGALDLSWEAGTVYQVSAQSLEGESVMFTGLLTSEQHEVDLSNSAPRAVTTLNFSHIRVDGVDIPG